MVDNVDEVGDTVLSDLDGRFLVTVPERLKNNIMVRVNVPGQIDNPRSRFALITTPAAGEKQAFDETIATISTQCRLLGVYRVANALVESTSNLGFQTSLAATFNQTAEEAGIFGWSRPERLLLAQRVADSVLAQVGDLTTVPVYEGIDDFNVQLRFVSGQVVPETGQKALPNWEQLIRLVSQIGDERIKRGENLAQNLVIKRVNAYLTQRRSALNAYPIWAPDGGFEFFKGADLGLFIYQGIFAPQRGEISELSNDPDFKAALLDAGLPKKLVNLDGRRSLFIKLGITLGMSESQAGEAFDRGMAAFSSVSAVVQREYVRNEQRYLNILKTAGTPKGRASLNRLGRARQ
jgi:hypothetical protein